MTDQPVGTKAFFDDLDEYRFDKLHYLPRLVDFSSFTGQRLLEVGCGIGTDLVRFAQGGARVTGVDLAQTAIDLARNFELNGKPPRTCGGNGEARTLMELDVFTHGVIQRYGEPAAQFADAPGAEAGRAGSS
jgi:SAM-dependent methyltransferase